MIFRFCVVVLATGILAGQPPVPSLWEGQARGAIRGSQFTLPLTIELRPSLPYEKNPFDLFVSTKSVNQQVGDFLLVSAIQFTTSGLVTQYYANEFGINPGVYTESANVPVKPGVAATLQYLNVAVQGASVTATLADTHAGSAAVRNMFTGPNVSMMEASDLMRSVMATLGPTEMFVFGRGAVVRMQFEGATLTGTVQGSGRSITNTTSDVGYSCRFQARRMK